MTDIGAVGDDENKARPFYQQQQKEDCYIFFESWTDAEQPDFIQSLLSKQRASVLWLLSKAYNREIPNELRDPYYKDHEEQYRLKPQIVHGLANAELYCLALANIYADPNYHCLNHHSIIQLLIRKGIYVTKPHDTDLTETILIQTSPIRMVNLIFLVFFISLPSFFSYSSLLHHHHLHYQPKSRLKSITSNCLFNIQRLSNHLRVSVLKTNTFFLTKCTCKIKFNCSYKLNS